MKRLQQLSGEASPLGSHSHTSFFKCLLTCACLLEAPSSGGIFSPELVGSLHPPHALLQAAQSGGSECQLWLHSRPIPQLKAGRFYQNKRKEKCHRQLPWPCKGAKSVVPLNKITHWPCWLVRVLGHMAKF